MLNSYLGLAFAFIIPTVLGFLILRLLEFIAKTPLSNRLPNLVACGVGTVIGWVFITFCMRVQHALGLPSSLIHTFALPLTLCISLLTIVRNQVNIPDSNRAAGTSRSMIVGIFMITLLGLPLVLEAGLQPLPGWDAWEFWATRAKVWFFTGDLADNRLQRNEEYPPAVSLMMLWVARAVGEWRDNLFSYISLLHLFSASLVMYWALQTRTSGHVALIGVGLALGAPLIAVHAITGGYADLPLACTLAIAASLLMCLPRGAALSHYMVSVGLALCLPFYKIPGVFWLAFFLLGALTHFYCSHTSEKATRIKHLSRTLVQIMVALATLALVFLRFTNENLKIGNYVIRFTLNDGTLFVINELFVSGSFLLLWLTFGFYFVSKTQKPPADVIAPIQALKTIVVLGVAFVLSAVFLGNTLEWWADGSTLNRALIHIAPTAILLVVFLAYSTAYSARQPIPRVQ
jgi:hypothetical protein